MLPPLFPSDQQKLDTDIATIESPTTTSSPLPTYKPIRSFASLHAGFWVIGAATLTVFGLVAFVAIGIITSTPSTASVKNGSGGNQTDLGNVYGAWTDLPQHVAASQDTVFDASTLQSNLATIIGRYDEHEFGIVVAPVDEGSQVRIGDEHVFTGASTTKLLTAAAILAGVDSGKWKLDQVAYELAAPSNESSGQEQPVEPTTEATPTPSPTPTPEPKLVTFQQALQLMINRSDNVSWEQLIKLLGSKSLRAFATEVGMQEYEVTTNRVSPRDMALLLQKIYSGELLSEPSKQLLLSYMQHTNEERMIPAAITENGQVYHKYGWLGSVVHDVAVVDNLGQPVIVVIMSDGESGYAKRMQMIRELSEAVNQALLAGHQN